MGFSSRFVLNWKSFIQWYRAELSDSERSKESKARTQFPYLLISFIFQRVDDLKEIKLSSFGLQPEDAISSANGLLYGDFSSIQTIEDVKNHLAQLYCGSLAVDFSAVEVSLYNFY